METLFYEQGLTIVVPTKFLFVSTCFVGKLAASESDTAIHNVAINKLGNEFILFYARLCVILKVLGAITPHHMRF